MSKAQFILACVISALPTAVHAVGDLTQLHSAVAANASVPLSQYYSVDVVHRNKKKNVIKRQTAEWYQSHGKHKMLLRENSDLDLQLWGVLSDKGQAYYFTRGARSEFFRLAWYWPVGISSNSPTACIEVWNEVGAGGANCLLFCCKDWFTWCVLLPALAGEVGYTARIEDQPSGLTIHVQAPVERIPGAYRINQFAFRLNSKRQVTGVRFGVDPESPAAVTDISYSYGEAGEYLGFVFNFQEGDVSYGTIKGVVHEDSSELIPDEEFSLAKYGLQDRTSFPLGWVVVATVVLLGTAVLGWRRYSRR